MSSEKEKKYYGFIGRILKVDLSKKSISNEQIDMNHTSLFLGGAGYACRYLIDKIDKNLDPLSSKNVLIIMTGPFCGTSAPSFGRFVICSKSPYTHLWGESNCGGFFGPELKRAGYDGLVIDGKAETPIVLRIKEELIEFSDASEYWGKGVKETQHKLKHEFGDYKSRILSIGPAGENLVKYANINADGRSAGRTGMGAILGSKNLKAIMVTGNNIRINIAKPEEFKKTVKKTISYLQSTMATKALRGYGTSAGVMTAHSFGDLPIKYWSRGEWEEVFNISGEKLKENLLIKNKSCYGCSIGCGRIIKIDGKESIYANCEGPEYETIAGFGSMILNSDLVSISIANNLCNNYGLDTISTSGVIAFLYDLYEKKEISKEDIDDLDLQWGNSDSMLKLIKKIAYREGIGDLLAEGSNKVGEKFQIDDEKIATIHNLEVPYHDIRSCYGLALTYAFAPRGACHTSGDVFKVSRQGNEIDYTSLGIEKLDMFSNTKKMAISSARVHDYRALYSSMISCFFSNPPPDYMAELISNLIGLDMDIEQLKLMGERIFTLKRLFNLKMGWTPESEKIPTVLLTPTNEGAVKGRTPNFEKLKRYYYEYRDWDQITGNPSSKKLIELELHSILE